ncbi:MAG: translation initiation factor IF-2 [Candidatus Auribacterota bacterium]|jgi:translation initiation factor IF-2|nr:translation initiation factor IF-2 [Candidatus Auribacterota bacterium]
MRVHELAKQLEIPAKDLVEQLKAQGVDVKNHMSGLDDDVVERWLNKSSASATKKVAPSKPAEPEDISVVNPQILDIELDDESDLREKKKDKPKKIRREIDHEDIVVRKPLKVYGDIDDDVEEEVVDVPAIRLFGGKKRKKKFGDKKKKERSFDFDYDNNIAEQPAPTPKSTDIYVGEEIVVKELADLIDIPVAKVIGSLIELGVMVTQNQKIDHETAVIIANEFGYEVMAEPKDTHKEEPVTATVSEEPPVDRRYLVEKSPVVTFMGHVDHGKTSLLDYIRKAQVAENEAGKITQHIGAYEAKHNNKRIVFLDTPGHSAFTEMRARGASATDIVVLVVAADDGIMEQTREAISHAQAAKVPIIVAINKIDKNSANVDRVLRQLSEMNLMPEDWGGQTICARVSAITGEGVDHLLEMILLQAEIMELKANPRGLAKGVVIESKMTRGRGPTVTVLIQKGTLRRSDPIFCGSYSGKVKSIMSDRGETLDSAGPATPVEILGLDGVPDAGTLFEALDTEKEAKILAQDRAAQIRKNELERVTKPTTLEELYEQIESDEKKELKLIIKGDVHGSIEALSKSLEELSTEKVVVHVVHNAVGDVSESDVMLAAASDAIIIGFCIKIDKRAREIARKEGVQIRTYSIIYEAIDDVYKAMSGLLEAKLVENIVGTVEVRETFKISRLGVIAGCYVKDGKALKNAKVRVLRDNDTLFTGELSSLKRFKDEVKEVKTGMECGIKIQSFDGIQVGDIIEFFVFEKVEQTL